MPNPNTRNVWAAVSTLALRGERITVRKVAALAGLPHYSTAYYQLAKLEDTGYVTKPRGPKTTAADWIVNLPLIDNWKVKEER